MNLKDVQENLVELGFETSQQKAILDLIDTKINNDMKEVISEIRRLEDKMDTKFGATDTKFSILIWAIGILIALIIALKFIN